VTPSREEIRQLARGDLDDADARRVLRSLLGVASGMADSTGEGPAPMTGWRRDPEPEYGPAFERAAAGARAAASRREREEARTSALLEELTALPFERQLDLVRSEARFASAPLVEQLCARSRALAGARPEQAEHLARLAVAVAEQLVAGGKGRRSVRDVVAFARGQLGDALRVRGELREAGVALRQAAEDLAAGSGEPLASARLASLRASLLNDLGRVEQAVALCRDATSQLRRVGARQALGRGLVKLAAFAAALGRFAESLEALGEAAELVDGSREPRLGLALRHNRAYCLERMGRYREAARELAAARALAEEAGSGIDLARVRWVEGRVALGLGRQAQAENVFREVAADFVEAGLSFDAALVALELALVLLHRGETREVRELAERMVPIFGAQGIHAEARAALELFRAAAAREALGGAFVVGLLAYLERARDRPDLRFEPTG